MTKLTPREVESALESIDEYFYWDDAGWLFRDNDALDASLVINGERYDVEVVAEETGTEGDWDIETFVVLKVGDQYFKKTGRYQSHYGNDWAGPFVEVEPYTRAVADFKEIGS